MKAVRLLLLRISILRGQLPELLPRKENILGQISFISPNTGAPIADGNAVAFDKAFSNKIDGDDALKLFNNAENFAIKSRWEIFIGGGKSAGKPFPIQLFLL